jgi:hypothetical protein
VAYNSFSVFSVLGPLSFLLPGRERKRKGEREREEREREREREREKERERERERERWIFNKVRNKNHFQKGSQPSEETVSEVQKEESEKKAL